MKIAEWYTREWLGGEGSQEILSWEFTLSWDLNGKISWDDLGKNFQAEANVHVKTLKPELALQASGVLRKCSVWSVVRREGVRPLGPPRPWPGVEIFFQELWMPLESLKQEVTCSDSPFRKITPVTLCNIDWRGSSGNRKIIYGTITVVPVVMMVRESCGHGEDRVWRRGQWDFPVVWRWGMRKIEGSNVILNSLPWAIEWSLDWSLQREDSIEHKPMGYGLQLLGLKSRPSCIREMRSYYYNTCSIGSEGAMS